MPTAGKKAYWLDEPVMVLRRGSAEERSKWEQGADPWWVRRCDGHEQMLNAQYALTDEPDTAAADELGRCIAVVRGRVH